MEAAIHCVRQASTHRRSQWDHGINRQLPSAFYLYMKWRRAKSFNLWVFRTNRFPCWLVWADLQSGWPASVLGRKLSDKWWSLLYLSCYMSLIASVNSFLTNCSMSVYICSIHDTITQSYWPSAKTIQRQILPAASYIYRQTLEQHKNRHRFSFAHVLTSSSGYSVNM